jgi:hypothetical protein
MALNSGAFWWDGATFKLHSVVSFPIGAYGLWRRLSKLGLLQNNVFKVQKINPTVYQLYAG